MSILLSVLIPSTNDRYAMLASLVSELIRQITDSKFEDEVEILTEVDNKENSVGNKRQILLQRAKGEYVVMIDSDDEVTDDYILEIMNAIKKDKPDVIGMAGYMSSDSTKIEPFKISKDLPYLTITNAAGINEYLRFNNHLCAIKKEIALKIGYRDMRFGEDYDYATRLKESGLIKTETYINKMLYHYKYISIK